MDNACIYVAAPPPTGLIRTHHTPAGYQPHAKDIFFYFLSYNRVVFLSLSAGVEGCWRPLRGVGGVFGGVGGPLSVPTCFDLDMSIRQALGFSGWALGCEGGR